MSVAMCGGMPGNAGSIAAGARVQRVVLLVLDGLRADVVGDARFPHLEALRRLSAHTLTATTVQPSVTAAAMTSLLSGVPPSEHGIASDRFALPRDVKRLRPLPREVALAGHATTGSVRQVPWLLRGLARRIVKELGVATAHFAPAEARELLRVAVPAIQRQRDGLIIMHWPDCDAEGHRSGWMSDRYLDAVSRMDSALGTLMELLAQTQHETLLLTLADHGGGGAVPDGHDSLHPLDCTIPIFVHGSGVHAQQLPDGHSLLDVPPTVLWALGLPVPHQWTGAPITGAFEPSGREAIRMTSRSVA